LRVSPKTLSVLANCALLFFSENNQPILSTHFA
jgi:hypothetical protein